MQYDSSVGQYRGKDGRFISRDKALGFVQGEVEALQATLQKHVRQAIQGRLSATGLAQKMSHDLKIYSIQMAGMARGGIKRISMSDYGKIGSAQRERNQRLRKFVDALQNGEITEKQAMQRAAQYAGTIKQVHSSIEHDEQKKYYQLARRILDPLAQHCQQCILHQTNGWVDATTVVPVGVECSCRQNCKCRIFYRN